MNEKNVIKTARRANRRREKGCCVLCGRKIDRMEQHHVGGRNHDPDLLAELCGGCHDSMTEQLRRADVNMEDTDDLIELNVRKLKAMALFVKQMGGSIWNTAEQLESTKRGEK